MEVHARCLARELRKKGIEAYFSSDPEELKNDTWDVIQTHGSGYAASHSRAVSVHTLHGTTLGRMAACGEWFWPRGYLAEGREIAGVLRSNVSLSVHPGLSLLRLARMKGKVSAVCGNGWDAADESLDSPESPPKELSLIDPTRPVWLYIGRGDDIVKGADRVRGVLALDKTVQLIAAPGSGFESVEGVFRTGRLDSEQTRSLMKRAHGLLVPSRYEGNSLVVLEALSLGLNVISAPVGGVSFFPSEIMGLTVLNSVSPRAILDSIRKAELLFPDEAARKARVETNRALLPRWSDVAESALNAVSEFQARGRR